ncbi:MAG: hypothetical protein R3F39_01410 [Myxococcota bacterium]
MGRSLLTLLVALATLAGCADKVTILNVVPRLTWVAVAPPVDGVVEITVWVSDTDGDPVDVDARWAEDPKGAGVRGDSLRMAPGGHGLVGLTTEGGLFDPNGEAHVVRWDVSDVNPQGPIRLHFVPDDLDAGVGQAVRTPPFTLSEGIPAPVPVEDDPTAELPRA